MIVEILDGHRKRGSAVVVVEAAVLIEAAWDDTFDEVWVAYARSDFHQLRVVEHIYQNMSPFIHKGSARASCVVFKAWLIFSTT